MEDTLSPKPDVSENCKVIYGQAYIVGSALVQDIIIQWPGGKSIENTVELIKDIWDDLMSSSSKIKSNKGSYFYWPVSMTDISNDDVVVAVNIEAPKPKPGLFKEPLDEIKENNEWVKYWLKKAKDSVTNFEKEYAIQRKNISMPGTSYISQTGEEIKLEDITVQNNALGDIENLLSIL